MTERGSKKRARVGLYTQAAIDEELAHLGPEAHDIDDATLAELLATESRRLHSLLRDQRLLAGIGRAFANEILNRSRLSPYALSGDLDEDEVTALGDAIRSSLAEGLDLRRQGRTDKKVYKVHNRLDEPCPNCATPIAQIDFEEHTIYYCAACQTGGRELKNRRLSRLLR
jgi:formamidopyrimidine-DNA glycosylase